MIRRRIVWIAFLGIFPVLISAIDTAGWWRWDATRRQLRLGSELVVQDLASAGWVRFPSFVERTRKLPVTALAGAPRESVVVVLARLGRLQTRWMPGGAAGFTHIALEKLLANQPGLAVPMLEEAVLRDPHSPYIRRLRGLIFLLAGARELALDEIAFAEAVAPGYRFPEVELTPEEQNLIRLRGLEMRREVYPRRQVDTALALARLLRNSGEADRAWEVLEELAGSPKIDLEIARWKLEAGDYLVALELLNGITSRMTLPRGLRAQAWSRIAVAQDELADPEGALEAAGEALRLDPDSPTPYMTLALLSERRGDLESALEYLRRAWGMAPSDIGLLLRIARVAERAGKPAEATQALVRAVELEPSSPEIAMRLVEAQLRDGRFAEAAMSLSRALDRFPTHSGLLNLADRLRRDIGIR